MNTTAVLESPTVIDDLFNHIQERTFGRLHDLTITQDASGRISVSAIAHSQFVCQLAEWAVLERMPPDQVELAIYVRRSTSNLIGVQK